jgi:hypothetical protein
MSGLQENGCLCSITDGGNKIDCTMQTIFRCVFARYFIPSAKSYVHKCLIGFKIDGHILSAKNVFAYQISLVI